MSEEIILLDHGSGGKASHRLISRHVAPVFANPMLDPLGDGAILSIEGRRLAFSTDTFVVDPIFFPGGDIGDLAVNGTVNDLAMCGAVPRYLSAGLILEEGFPVGDLDRVLASMARAAKKAGVHIVTGDTKVVPRGAADRIFINTSGIGLLPPGVDVGPHRIRPGDAVLLSGTMGDHGLAILNSREGIELSSALVSDTAAVHELSGALVASLEVHCLRDPTRGGVGTTLCEIAESGNAGILLFETALPVRPEVKGGCELLGLNPLHLANEGKFLAIVAERDAESALSLMKSHSLGRDAALIGRVTEEQPGRVIMETAIGGRRFVDRLAGEQLPRIC